MPSMRVHELAKEFGMSSKELLDKLQDLKIPAKNHASTLVEAYVDKIRKALGPEIAERQIALEEERTKLEAAEAAKAKAAEEAAHKAAEEAAHKAALEERKRRDEEHRLATRRPLAWRGGGSCARQAGRRPRRGAESLWSRPLLLATEERLPPSAREPRRPRRRLLPRRRDGQGSRPRLPLRGLDWSPKRPRSSTRTRRSATARWR